MSAKSFGFAATLMLLAGVFIYPTPFVVQQLGSDVKRVNRLSGVVQYATEQGWQTQSEMLATSIAKSEERVRFLIRQGTLAGYFDNGAQIVLSHKSGPQESVIHNSLAANIVRDLRAAGIPELGPK